MNKIGEVVLQPLEKSIYVKPLSLVYTHNGKPRKWDFLAVHDSVAIIIYNISRNVLLFVKQFRPPVYIGSIPKEDRVGVIDVVKYPAELGITVELCAGIVDKELSIAEIASEEVLEECGYKVDHSLLKKVSSFRSGVGTSGATQTLFYCEVTDDMKVGDGGGVEDELIDVVEMTIPEVKEFVSQDHVLSPPSFLYGLYWFFAHKGV